MVGDGAMLYPKSLVPHSDALTTLWRLMSSLEVISQRGRVSTKTPLGTCQTCARTKRMRQELDRQRFMIVTPQNLLV
ncbi:hypothetical protein KIN20_025259 [Parelaphostrongylus tenuis]|uniref:Uncharacterized protein n=1 Tax=Parelaphostrongylus tenuis TaxID=148309 RepID=A0AAD5N8M3_PARTN|nr:hypothetical protein KIN20_025259 [Parelaphostrongylus tenuis]